MTNVQRRIKHLEERLTDSHGFVPHTQAWLEHWDREFYLHLTHQPTKGKMTIEAYRAVVKYADENPASLTGSFLKNQESEAY